MMSKILQNYKSIMNLSDISIIFVVGGLLPRLFLTGKQIFLITTLQFHVKIAKSICICSQEKSENGEYYINELLSSIIKFNSNSNEDNQQQDSQQQDSQQQDSQQAKITVVGTDDSTCETSLYEKVKLDGIIIEPEEKLLIADLTPCKISDGKVTFDITINPKLQLGIPYTDLTDNKYGHVNDNSLSIKTALLSPTEVHNGKDTRLFAIELHDGEEFKDSLTEEKTIFTNIDELYLYNSGDEPLEFKSGDNFIIRGEARKINY